LNTCKTCKYWGGIPKGSYSSIDSHKNLGTCSCPKIQYGYGAIDVSDNGAVIENDEGWGMLVGLGFGCIHHSE